MEMWRGLCWRKKPGLPTVFIDDPRWDYWETVQDFIDYPTAVIWYWPLVKASLHAVLTAPYPLDRHRTGDLSLRVAPGQRTQAREILIDEELLERAKAKTF